MPDRTPEEHAKVIKQRVWFVMIAIGIVLVSNVVLLYLHFEHGLSPMFSALTNGLILALITIAFLLKTWSTRRTEPLDESEPEDD